MDGTSGCFRMALDDKSQKVTVFGNFNGALQVEETAHRFGVSARSFPKFNGVGHGGFSYEVALVYLDDIIIFGKFFAEHLNRLDLVVGRLKDAKLKKKGSKF